MNHRRSLTLQGGLVEQLLAAVAACRAGCGTFAELWACLAERLRAVIPAAGLSVLSFPLDVLTCYPSSDRGFIEFRCRHDPEVSRRFSWNFQGLGDYVERYAARDPSAAALIRGRGCPVRLSQVVAEDRREDNAFTAEFLPHWNLRHVLAAAPALGDHARIGITLYREPDQPDFTAREAQLLQLLAPHLSEASRQTLLAERRGRGEELTLIGADGGQRRFEAAARAARLSPRERQVAALAARGLANKEIARELGIRKNTVKEYLSKAYQKTGADGRAALIAYLYGG